MRVITVPGVFQPRSDTWMLVGAVRAQALTPGAKVLDLCTGSGVIGVAAAIRGAAVTSVDVSRRALLSAWLNARVNGVRLRPRRGSLFDAVDGQRFDLVVANPPYLPAATESALAERGLDVDIVFRHRGALGPIMRERATSLWADGRLTPGSLEEDIVIVRGRRPLRGT
jgi:release factor glutamine methyltransferase